MPERFIPKPLLKPDRGDQLGNSKAKNKIEPVNVIPMGAGIPPIIVQPNLSIREQIDDAINRGNKIRDINLHRN